MLSTSFGTRWMPYGQCPFLDSSAKHHWRWGQVWSSGHLKWHFKTRQLRRRLQHLFQIYKDHRKWYEVNIELQTNKDSGLRELCLATGSLVSPLILKNRQYTSLFQQVNYNISVQKSRWPQINSKRPKNLYLFGAYLDFLSPATVVICNSTMNSQDRARQLPFKWQSRTTKQNQWLLSGKGWDCTGRKQREEERGQWGRNLVEVLIFKFVFQKAGLAFKSDVAPIV